jgi:hypothetical protein
VANIRGLSVVWFVLPLFATVGMTVGLSQLGPAWAAHNGEGVQGTFTAQWEKCKRSSCHYEGRWAAADGSKSFSRTTLNGDDVQLSGEGTAPALYSGDSDNVYATAGVSAPIAQTVLVVACFLAGIGWLIFVVRKVIGLFRRSEPVHV